MPKREKISCLSKKWEKAFKKAAKKKDRQKSKKEIRQR